ncbi:tachykinin-like peptides receptor 99D isoform X2 [Frankliniella occidentalis]|uniref:Tachykinin-like peptides receptor 99D isoform X2 n=1 Tax=Frankliniella occidentalis TaxID=133901 RepID=A0A9C6UB88_FRAOC|nr:tachykinin-like peptides receptor 99D isoform X2 [Frankliniella occidentalis]
MVTNGSAEGAAAGPDDPVLAGLAGLAGLMDGNASSAWTASPLPWMTSNLTVNASDGFPLNDTEYGEFHTYELPVWRQVLWSALFAGMVIVAACGNVMVIWIVLAHKRMRTVTNYFLVNLSIADAMVSLLNVTATYVGMLHNNWPFGRLYCKLSQFVAVLSICASVFTLMAISIDRYMAIMYPLRRRLGKRTTLALALGIWVVGSAMSSPMLFYQTTELVDGDRVLCYAEWPDGPTTRSHQEYVYNVVFMVVTYFVPITLMGLAYLRVGIELWGSQSIGECTQRQLQNIQSKRRVVKMMIVVVTIFGVCWLPFHLYFIITSEIPEITSSAYVQEVYLGIYWLAMSNSMYNPIIYCYMNSRFRRGFQAFFWWCPCVRRPQAALSRREAVTSRYSVSGSPDHHTRIVRNGSTPRLLALRSNAPDLVRGLAVATESAAFVVGVHVPGQSRRPSRVARVTSSSVEEDDDEDGVQVELITDDEDDWGKVTEDMV